jgi:enoyl-CoA hydratase
MAKRLVLSGVHIKAEEAYRIGLVTCWSRRRSWTTRGVAGQAHRLQEPHRPGHGKKHQHGCPGGLRTGLSIEARCFSLCFGSQDRVESMNAFLEKRKPAFTGK